MKQKLRNLLPMAFCASLSLICAAAVAASRSPGAGVIPFLCFLPMSFFFVGIVTTSLQQEIRELQAQLAKMQEKRITPHGAD
jgi:hypothetical protein